MKKHIIFLSTILFVVCQKRETSDSITFLAQLPTQLKEVSGNELMASSPYIWMLNDSGNSSKIYGVSGDGLIKKEITIDAKNHDWEDLASDENGNLYIGDFGNNKNKRKNLRILKIPSATMSKQKAKVEIIEFEYENQTQFPPNKEQLFFDAEAFFYYQNHFYVFTKSRIKKRYGHTFLYKIPAKKGKHIAKLIGEYYNGNEDTSWITGADISDDGTAIALLSQKNVLIFTNFKGDAFFTGTLQTIPIDNPTQKEGICFKNNATLLITDEKTSFTGGNLYSISLTK